MINKYLALLTKRPWVVSIVAVLAIVAIATGAQHLRFGGHYRVFFDEGDSRVVSYDNIQSVYSQSDNVFIVVTAPQGIYTPETLAVIREITEKAWTLPYVQRVDSITNFQNTVTIADDLVVADLVEKNAELTQERLAYIKSVAINEPNLKDLLVENTGKITGINLTVKIPEDNPDALPELASQARELVTEFREKHSGLEYRLAGEIMLTNAFIEATIHDFGVLTPIMFLVVILVIGITLRSVLATVLGVFFSALCIEGAMGTAGWTGMMLTPPTSVAPTIILTIAVATYIHVYTTFLQHYEHREGKWEAVLKSVRLNFKPITLTCLTTIIGFLSMNFSTVPPFRDLGNVVVFGVISTYFLSYTLLPAMLILAPRRPTSRTGLFSGVLGGLGKLVTRHHVKLLVASSTLGVLLTFAASKNEISERFVDQFSHRIEFRNSAEYVNDNLTGVYNIEYSIGSGEQSGVYDPSYFAQLDSFTRWLRAQPEVVHVRSFSDTLKRLNKNLNGDSPEFYRLPAYRDAIAQSILMYEMSLPFGLGISDQISLDKGSSRVIVTFGNISTKEVLALEHRISLWAQQNMPHYSMDSGSPTLMFSHIGYDNARSLFLGTFAAFILIAVFLGIFFRSYRFGLLSMFANLLPITSAFGVWGLLVGEVGMGVSVVAGMTIGIVVDDTVHFINKYLYARRSLGLLPAQSIEYCFKTVGVALLSTTVILVCGFAVICFSDFMRNASMAQMNALTIGLALLFDFVFLPSLILVMEKLTHEKSTKVPAAPFSASGVSRI